MPTYTTPGVYVTESALAPLTQPTTSGTAAVFFGEANRGPTTATLIQDWPTYKNTYGDLTNSSDLGYAVYHYFANGGRNCYVVRVVASAAAVATSASVPYYPTGSGAASASLFSLTTTSKGAWGNSVTVSVAKGNIPGTASTYGTFALVVFNNGVEVERWTELTRDPNGSRYAPAVINTYSKYVNVTSTAGVSSISTAATSASEDWFTGARTFTGGSDGTIAPDTDYPLFKDTIDIIDGPLILNVVGKASTTIVTAFGTKAKDRGDSILIVDPVLGDADYATLETTVANLNSVTPQNYIALYTPMLKMIDPAKSGPGAVRTTYPGGAVCGLIVRTETERTVAKAPAGYAADIRGALGLSVTLTDDQIGRLYSGVDANGVPAQRPQANSFKVVPGGGITVYGARTMTKVTPDKHISVRRTLNHVKYNLKALTRFAVFEPNDLNLWNTLNLTISGFLNELWRSGALKGNRSSDAFYVVCDSTNNSSVSMDNGQVNIQVGVALLTPAEFIVIDVSQWTGGSNTVETL